MKLRLRIPFLWWLAPTIAIFLTSQVRANTVWFVKANATGTGTGLSWTNAFTTLDAAIAAISATRDAQGNSDQIWVAEGTYFPPVVGTVSTGFSITKPVNIYGGFKGTETSVAGRLGSFLLTILDGNVNNPSLITDNAYHVLNISGVAGVSGTPGVTIDGFLIRNGYSNSSGTGGAGIYSAATDLDLANCFVRQNYAAAAILDGGGLHFTSLNGGSYPTGAGNLLRVKDCEFSGNTGYQGGGLMGDYIRGEIVNTQFLSNGATPYGAGVYLTRMGSSNQLDFTNCTFWQNTCSGGGSDVGAGIYLAETGSSAASNAKLVNCTLSDNSTASDAAGVALAMSTNSQATVYNSILWHNGSGSSSPIVGAATVNYSDVQGGWTGSGNISDNPQFANHSLGRLNLLLAPNVSPCLDAGDYSRVPTDNLDLDGDGNVTEVLPLDLGSSTRLIDQTSVTDTGTGSSACSNCTYLDMGVLERP